VFHLTGFLIGYSQRPAAAAPDCRQRHTAPALQKGFLLTVVVLLAAAFFASYYNDNTGYATRSTRTVVTTRQPVNFFSLDEFLRTFIKKPSKTTDWGLTGPEQAGPCYAYCQTKQCAWYEYCGQTGGTSLNPVCGCIQKPGEWVDTDRVCFFMYSRYVGDLSEVCSRKSGLCKEREECRPISIDPARCNCYRFEEELSTF